MVNRSKSKKKTETEAKAGKVSTTTSLTIRIDRETKREAEILAAKLGTNLCNAVNILIAGFVRNYAFPAEYLRAPRESVEEIAEAMQEVVDMEFEELAEG